VNANSAAIGGSIATAITYPVDIVKTKLQASKGDDTAMGLVSDIIKEQGLLGLFKGIEPKLVWSFVGKFVYYGAYSAFNQLWDAVMKSPLGLVPNLVMGYICEFTTVPFSLPFEAIATRMQTSKGETFAQATANIYKNGGFGAFYGSVSAYFVLCITPAVTNTVFTQIKNVMMKSRGKPLNAALGFFESFLLGAIARATAVCLMFPFLRAKTLMQASTKGDQPQKSSTQLIQDLLAKEGFFALYRGLGPELLRGVLSSSITMMLKERVYAVNRSMIVNLVGKQAVAK